MFNLKCFIMKTIEEISKFRRMLTATVNEGCVCDEIKPAIQSAVTALLQIEFVAFCLTEDGRVVELNKDSSETA